MIKSALALGLVLQCFGPSAYAVELAGRYGFIGEWDVSASLTERATPQGRRELNGRISMKHTAICGPGETPVKSGEIAMRLPRAGKRFSARLDLDGDKCDFTGELSEDAVSFIKCSGQESIPLRLWLKDSRLTVR